MKNIASMTAEDVYSDETLDEVFSDEDEIHKAKVLLTLEDRAAQLLRRLSDAGVSAAAVGTARPRGEKLLRLRRG